MPRASTHGLPPGIHLDKTGAYWATLEGNEAACWRDRYPGRTVPRRKAKTLGEAVQLQRRLIKDLETGRDPNPENPTVAIWVERWIENRRRLKPKTRRRYLQSLRYQIKPLRIGRLRLRQVRRDLVNEWVHELTELPRQDDPDRLIDAHSIDRAFSVLRAAMNGAVFDGLIPSNPCIGVELPRPDYDEMTPMTPEQVKHFLQMLDTYEEVKDTKQHRPHRQAALYHVAIRCGLRKGELNGLRWRDIDLQRRQIRISGQIQDGERTEGKSKHAHRTIPISATLVEVLRCHLQNQEEERSISPPGWNRGGYVFCTEYGTPFNPANIWRQFDAFQRRAGLTEPCTICDGDRKQRDSTEPCGVCEGYGVVSSFRFHDMRHTYAALSLAAGVDIFTVSRRMGHSSITVTSDRYGHLYQGRSDDAGAIDGLLEEDL